MRVDNLALLPAYLAAGTALLALVVDLVMPDRRVPVQVATVLGAAATGAAAIMVGTGPVRQTFCLPAAGCSYVANTAGATIAAVFAAVTLVVAALSGPVLRAGVPAGEYFFLLGCSMTGGVVVGYSGDLITLIISLETLTLPLYIMVGLVRRSVASAEGAVTFFVVSVVSTSITLLGTALLYMATGAVHFAPIAAKLGDAAVRGTPIATTGVVLVLAGLAFKVAAVPLHAWAPPTYDGAPVPVAAYLSTASKLGGVVAIWYVSVKALGPALSIAGPLLAALAVATMTVGNLVALRQRRMVRLLAWSSIAQAGYILAPFGAFAVAGGRTSEAVSTAVAASLGYLLFYVLLELGAFGAVVALRGGRDGGEIDWYRGAARRAPWVTTAFVLALTGLAGLPPGIAGLFAKAFVISSLLTGASGWLAVIVALNAVVGLAYYLRVMVVLFAAPEPAQPPAGAAAEGAPGSVPGAGAVPGQVAGAAGAVPGPATGTVPEPSTRAAVLVGATTGAASGTPGAAVVTARSEPARAGAAVAEATADMAPAEVAARPAARWPVRLTLTAVTLAGLVVGVFPQLIMGLTNLAAR